MSFSNVHAVKPENPFDPILPTNDTPATFSTAVVEGVDEYMDFQEPEQNVHSSPPVVKERATNEPNNGQRPPEKIERSKLDDIAAALSSSNAEQPFKINQWVPEQITDNNKIKANEPASTEDQARDEAYAEMQEYRGDFEDHASDPELGVPENDDRVFKRAQIHGSCHEYDSTIFNPSDERSAGVYFSDRWIPWLLHFLDVLMDFILMFSLVNPFARCIQGFFFFLPYIVLWSSTYNTSKYEPSYLVGGMDMPITAWLNGLPWTGVPMVMLQEWYVIFYRFFIFPYVFWKHSCRHDDQPFYISGNIYNKKKSRYFNLVRVVFEDLPSIVLMLVVMGEGEDKNPAIFFSIVTSIVSCACTIYELYLRDRGGRPIYHEVFISLMGHQIELP